jgi:SAM-dependent methyltransferase
VHLPDPTLTYVTWGACPACGGSLEPWRRVPSAEPALRTQWFELARCECCGSAVTVGEAPEDLHDSGAYSVGTPRLHRLALPLLNAFDRHRLALLRQLVKPPASLLDVGAGRGRFVINASAAGYDARGIEPSARGALAAADLGASVRQASLERAELEPASLDAATMWHVLEHLDDPGAALADLRHALKPAGALLVGVPNLASLQAKFGGARWYHLDVPRHRTHFTPRGLVELLTTTGFTPLSPHHLLAEHNPFGMWQSVVSRLTRDPSYLYNLLKRNASLRSRDLPITIAALPLAPIAAGTELLAGVTRRGGTIAVLAQRGYD